MGEKDKTKYSSTAPSILNKTVWTKTDMSSKHRFPSKFSGENKLGNEHRFDNDKVANCVDSRIEGTLGEKSLYSPASDTQNTTTPGASEHSSTK